MDPALSSLLSLFAQNFPTRSSKPIEDAYQFASVSHQGMVRKSGEPLLQHDLAVATIVAELGLEADWIAAALLHDVDPTPDALEHLEWVTSPTVRFGVERLARVRKIRPRQIREREMESYRKMVLAVAEDLRVVLIRVADRLHNMRTIDALPPQRQKELAREVRLLYVPLANRMGLSAVKSELENRCFAMLEPHQYQELKAGVEEIERSRRDYINEVVALLRERLHEAGFAPKVYGRPKHLYSIYLKMERQGKSLSEIHDMLGFRVICETAQHCYGILGVIHSFLKPFPKLFKDYIALPKPNGYQSLHTSVEGPRANRIEIQIRTQEMHDIAENGVAAHWLYKERHRSKRMDTGRFRAIRNTGEYLQGHAQEANDNLWSLASFQSEIFVFTPTGELVVLPKEGTALDFAFAVHTQVGAHCTGAKVNGSMVPLRSPLQTWDRVEILTGPHQHPNPDWLSFVVTSKAKNKIRHYMRTLEREESRKGGRTLVERALRKHKISFSRLLKEGAFERAARLLKSVNQEALFMALGDNKIGLHKVLRIVAPEALEQVAPRRPPEERRRRKKRRSSGPPIEVDGLRNVLVKFAHCCDPLPGEPIKGYVTRGRGISIHQARCPRLEGMLPERIVTARWLVDPTLGDPVVLKIIADNRLGLVEKMREVFTKQGQNIQRISMEHLNRRMATLVYFTATKEQTDLLVRNLRKLRGVYSVSRTRT